MKPETARKLFVDSFRYWHPVTNNDVQKYKAYTLSSLTLPQITYKLVFGSVLFD